MNFVFDYIVVTTEKCSSFMWSLNQCTPLVDLPLFMRHTGDCWENCMTCIELGKALLLYKSLLIIS